MPQICNYITFRVSSEGTVGRERTFRKTIDVPCENPYLQGNVFFEFAGKGMVKVERSKKHGRRFYFHFCVENVFRFLDYCEAAKKTIGWEEVFSERVRNTRIRSCV